MKSLVFMLFGVHDEVYAYDGRRWRRFVPREGWRREVLPFWARHPRLGGFALFLVILALGLLLGGCECGRLWPCPGWTP